MLPEISFPYNPVGSWFSSNPYTIAFVHTPTKDFVVKGGWYDVKAHFGKEPAFIVISFWYKGQTRRLYRIENMKQKFYFNQRKGEYVLQTSGDGFVVKYRRVPSTFPKALKQFLV